MKSVITFAAMAFTSLAFAQAQNVDPSGFFNQSAVGAEVDMEALEQAFNLDKKPVQIAGDHPCAKLALTDAQIADLKKAFIALKRATIQDKADLAIAKLDYFVALSDTKSSKAVATTTSEALSTAVGAMVKAHLAFVNDVVFDILTVDQREPALGCMAFMHHMNEAMKLKKACEKHFKKPGPVAP